MAIQHNWGGLATPTEYDAPKCGEGVLQYTLVDGHWVRHPTCKRAGVPAGWALPLTMFTDFVHLTVGSASPHVLCRAASARVGVVRVCVVRASRRGEPHDVELAAINVQIERLVAGAHDERYVDGGADDGRDRFQARGHPRALPRPHVPRVQPVRQHLPHANRANLRWICSVFPHKTLCAATFQ